MVFGEKWVGLKQRCSPRTESRVTGAGEETGRLGDSAEGCGERRGCWGMGYSRDGAGPLRSATQEEGAEE